MFLTKINITIFRNILKKYIYFRDFNYDYIYT